MPDISDQERHDLIVFMLAWLRGDYMKVSPPDLDQKWARISELFPSGVKSPIRLFRLVTLPIRYADMQEFTLSHPAPKSIGSWTSTHFGIASVAGVADDLNWTPDTARIVISATIDPKNILASHRSLKRAFLTPYE